MRKASTRHIESLSHFLLMIEKFICKTTQYFLIKNQSTTGSKSRCESATIPPVTEGVSLPLPVKSPCLPVKNLLFTGKFLVYALLVPNFEPTTLYNDITKSQLHETTNNHFLNKQLNLQ